MSAINHQHPETLTHQGILAFAFWFFNLQPLQFIAKSLQIAAVSLQVVANSLQGPAFSLQSVAVPLTNPQIVK